MALQSYPKQNQQTLACLHSPHPTFRHSHRSETLYTTLDDADSVLERVPVKVNWFVGGPDVYGVGRKTVEAQRVSIGAGPTTVSGEAGRDAIEGLIVVSLRKVAGLTDVMCSPSIKEGAELNGTGRGASK